jgi:subtilisin family serine protease
MRRPDLTGNGGVVTASTNGVNGGRKQKNLTGRHTVIFHEDATDEGIALMRSAGFKVYVANPADPEVVREDQVGDVDVFVQPTTGTATFGGSPDQITLLQNWEKDPNSPIKAVIAEKVRRIIPVTTQSTSSGPAAWQGTDLWPFLEKYFGYAGKINSEVTGAESAAVLGFDESKATWGLQILNVANSPFSGRGVKVAVLDTGMDLNMEPDGTIRYHPDFEGRKISQASFVDGVDLAKDDHGHGTHCIGTACGPRKPPELPGYGVAYEAHIFAGKVLNSDGAGADGWIINGINWAINQGCRVISMSLGASRDLDEPFIKEYEDVAQRALKAGTVIVAAAGNDSSRPFFTAPVSGPADCPSIIAVGALNPQLRVASFSNAGLNANGGEVNVAAPGVEVYSSFRDGGHARLDGTSMATPHVAGVAALLAQANPGATGSQLSELVINSVKGLSLKQQDVGNGLIQAPLTSGLSALVNAASQGGVKFKQTSPITVGGGGSVGICFNLNHYKPQAVGGGSPRTKFVSTDRIEKLRLIDKFGGQVDKTPATVNCRIEVHTVLLDEQGNAIPNSDSPIVIYGSPLVVELNTADYEFGVPDGSDNSMYFKMRRKITGTVDVFEGAATLPAARHAVPTGGVCTVDVLNFP